MSSQRLVLFIDAQNLYQDARRAFFELSDWHIYGQVKPLELGNLICSRPPRGVTRSLHQVRVYTGRPDASKEPKSYGAHMKQCASWEKAGAIVVHRPLRYPLNWPNQRAQQKGVDVALAVDFVALATDGNFDVGVIASTDTDLLPALEFVHRRKQATVEVVAWSSLVSWKRLRVAEAQIECYWLDKNDYDAIADLTDYTR